MARAGLTILIFAALGVAQAVVSATPAQLHTRLSQVPPLAYELRQTSAHTAQLELHGVEGRRPPVYLLRLTGFRAATPIRRRLAVSGRTLRFDMRLASAPGTYKLKIPGNVSFGLLNVGR